MSQFDLIAYFSEYSKADASIYRKIIKNHKKDLTEPGYLGDPANVVVRPGYWQMRKDPARYLSTSWGHDKTNEQYHLARAAVVNVEKRIWKELHAVGEDFKKKLEDNRLPYDYELGYQVREPYYPRAKPQIESGDCLSRRKKKITTVSAEISDYLFNLFLINCI